MDRIINVKVGGNYLSKDNKNAGVRGEANVTNLRITFDEGWDGYAKTVTFFDAYGNNPVKRTLTADLVENMAENARIYLVPIPKEPLAIAGELTFVVEGYVEGKRQRSIADKLVVKDSPDTDNAGEPTDPTPDQIEQLQEQIDKIMGDVQKAAISEQNAKTSEENAKISEENAKDSEDNALNYSNDANKSSQNASKAARRAEIAITHNPQIINGYWHIWDTEKETYTDTGIKAQAGSTVYCGDNPPADADVWVNPLAGDITDVVVVITTDKHYGDAIYTLLNDYIVSGLYAFIDQVGSAKRTYTLYVSVNKAMYSGSERDLIEQQLISWEGVIKRRKFYINNGVVVIVEDWKDCTPYTKAESDTRHNDLLYQIQNTQDIANNAYGFAAEVKDDFEVVKSDVEGLQKQVNEEAHFRGYLSTNAKIQSMEATPNDFAYSAESNTKWVYDAVNGWQDTSVPVPDQLTPASETTPLINGVATVGTEEAYARGDHRHPTDTTRLSVTEFNEFKTGLETGLDNIIAIQNALIGGGSV